MAHELESETMDLLASTVEDEKKTVTYRWLSRSMGYSVNVAKQFMETYLSTTGHNKVHATYYLSRLDPSTGNKSILLVSQEDLKAATKDAAVVSHHIYSLEPSTLKDRSVLSVANAEANQMQKGKDINLYRIVQNKDVTISKSANRGVISAPAAPKPNNAFAAKPTAPATKPAASVVSPSPSSTSAPVANTLASAPATATASKSKAAPKSSMMSFFGKAGAAKPASTTSTTKPAAPAASKSSPITTTSSLAQKRKADSMNNQPRSTPQVSDDDEDEVDSEEERDRRLALSSRLDQDQGPVTASASKPVDLAAAKKRQRSAKLLAVDDDDEEEEAKQDEDDEDVKVLSKEARIALEKEKDAQRLALENMMLMDDHHATVDDEDSVMIDVESVDVPFPPVAPVTPSSSVVSSVSNGNGTITRRVRGHRAVTKKKTSVNERGYMVTESVVLMEPFSEDEIIEEAPAAAPAPAPARTEPAKVATGGPKKKAGGAGNQSLLNFFSKK
ncbi:hypothetical protein CPC16_007679 [Podila verticillata]|nr:hypothetical protein CPC16_007679 [Podila verticillata]